MPGNFLYTTQPKWDAQKWNAEVKENGIFGASVDLLWDYTPVPLKLVGESALVVAADMGANRIWDIPSGLKGVYEDLYKQEPERETWAQAIDQLPVQPEWTKVDMTRWNANGIKQKDTVRVEPLPQLKGDPGAHPAWQKIGDNSFRLRGAEFGKHGEKWRVVIKKDSAGNWVKLSVPDRPDNKPFPKTFGVVDMGK